MKILEIEKGKKMGKLRFTRSKIDVQLINFLVEIKIYTIRSDSVIKIDGSKMSGTINKCLIDAKGGYLCFYYYYSFAYLLTLLLLKGSFKTFNFKLITASCHEFSSFLSFNVMN